MIGYLLDVVFIIIFSSSKIHSESKTNPKNNRKCQADRLISGSCMPFSICQLIFRQSRKILQKKLNHTEKQLNSYLKKMLKNTVNPRHHIPKCTIRALPSLQQLVAALPQMTM